MSRRSWIMIGSVAVIGLAIAVVLFLPSGDKPQTPMALRMERQKSGDTGNKAATPSSNIVLDFFSTKYSLSHRAEFHVTSSQPSAIFVVATGVEISTDSGWEPFSEEPRNEIWRLTNGVKREMYVERPERESKQKWRAYIRYGTEMKGPPLLATQLREAWRIRSISNWTGKPWGGGHFNGAHEIFSEEFLE
ncbi:MAG: hypothetical protein ACR2H1_00300 [Limisphaerales bacterium]